MGAFLFFNISGSSDMAVIPSPSSKRGMSILDTSFLMSSPVSLSSESPGPTTTMSEFSAIARILAVFFKEILPDSVSSIGIKTISLPFDAINGVMDFGAASLEYPPPLLRNDMAAKYGAPR